MNLRGKSSSIFTSGGSALIPPEGLKIKPRGRNSGNVKESCELIDATCSSVTGGLTWRTLLPEVPQQVPRQCRSESCSAVATNEDQFIQVLDLQSIVQRVAESVRPVK